MIEKYTNPELHARFKRIQAQSSNNRLREMRAAQKNINRDPLQIRQRVAKENAEKGYDPYFLKRDHILDNTKPNEFKNNLQELEKVKNERARKSYKIKRQYVNPDTGDMGIERQRLIFRQKQARDLTNGKYSDPELAQKITKDLEKKGVRFVKDPNPKDGDFYKTSTGELHIVDKHNPATILHEDGHRLSIARRETRPEYYNRHDTIYSGENTSVNLENSIKNKVGRMATLTEEANASYHQAARQGKRYGSTAESLKAGKKSLDNSYRTYETSEAYNMLMDNYWRRLGKLRNR